MLDYLRSDLEAYVREADHPPKSKPAMAVRLLLLQRLQAVVLLRFAQGLSNPYARTLVKAVNAIITGSDIASEAVIGPGLQLFHPSSVVIGPRCVVGSGCKIMQGVTLGHGRSGSPTVGDDVFLGSNAVLVGGITIGSNSHIGANVVLTVSVPENSRVRAPKPLIEKRGDRSTAASAETAPHRTSQA
jgi:serine O-acetyltransferase